jgi:CheY-like chemotaxis protein
VLIADDDPHVRRLLRRLLERQGYACAEAQDGLEAVEIARRSQPRVVFLDLILPELNGLEAMRQLRADPATQGVSIHCLAPPKDRRLRRQAREIGCDGFVKKPVRADTLLDLVSIAMYSRS